MKGNTNKNLFPLLLYILVIGITIRIDLSNFYGIKIDEF
jgi:hypothetical protein